jgi:hypothetical protein
MLRHYISAVIIFCLAARSAAQPAPVGTEVQGNITTAGQQAAAAAAAGPSGLHAVAWQGPGNSTDIWLQAWEGDGSVLRNVFASEFRVVLCIPLAVCARLQEAEDGRLWIVFDDVKAVDSSPVEWKHWAFFTEMSFEREGALSHSLTDESYMAVGQAVMARLVALRNLVSRNRKHSDE